MGHLQKLPGVDKHERVEQQERDARDEQRQGQEAPEPEREEALAQRVP